MNWYILIGSFAYIALGWLANKIVPRYIYGLCKDVEKVDPRYIRRMWIYVKTKSAAQKYVLSVVFYIIWPIMAIAAILKAEWNYDSIVRHNWKRVR